MNRTRALIIIGGFMLALAVLAALELRKDDEVLSEGQMVTGSVDKSATPPVSIPTQGENASMGAAVSMPEKSSSSSGVLVSLDNGTLRAPESGSSGLPRVPTAPSALPQTDSTVEVPLERSGPAVATPVPTAPAAPTALTAQNSPSGKPAVAAEQPKNKQETAAQAEPAEKAEPSPLVMTTKAPAKLQGKQKAITRTRLELGKTITFRLTGAAPLTAKTLLLTGPDRYVVDLQGEWGVTLPKIPQNLLLTSIRVGQREGATRLVLELKRKPEGAEVIKIDAKTLEVRIR